MDEISYQESGDMAILASETDGEWIQSDSIVVLSDWT
jgi:hypothetical protein